MDRQPSSYSFDVPRHFTSVAKSSYAYRWLERYPASLVAVNTGIVEVRYDPKQNRLVFMYRVVSGYGCAGRSLSKGVSPKWYRYDKYSLPAMYCDGVSKTGVLVEDAVSAAAVAATGEYAGIALLGTNLSSGFTQWANFSKMIVALDKDASLKALNMQRSLSWFKPTSVCLLDKDLKCYNIEEIKKQLNAV